MHAERSDGGRGPLRRAAALADGLPERVWLLVDAALAEFGDADLVPLLERRERVLIVHSGAKAHALAGLRAGYALGPPGPLLIASRLPGGSPPRPRPHWPGRSSTGQRSSPAAAPLPPPSGSASLRRSMGRHWGPSHGVGPLVWLRASASDGRTLAAHLAARRITVMPGEAWGDDAHVRVTLRDAPSTGRLVSALLDTGAYSVPILYRKRCGARNSALRE